MRRVIAAFLFFSTLAVPACAEEYRLVNFTFCSTAELATRVAYVREQMYGPVRSERQIARLSELAESRLNGGTCQYGYFNVVVRFLAGRKVGLAFRLPNRKWGVLRSIAVRGIGFLDENGRVKRWRSFPGPGLPGYAVYYSGQSLAGDDG